MELHENMRTGFNSLHIERNDLQRCIGEHRWAPHENRAVNMLRLFLCITKKSIGAHAQENAHAVDPARRSYRLLARHAASRRTQHKLLCCVVW